MNDSPSQTSKQDPEQKPEQSPQIVSFEKMLERGQDSPMLRFTLGNAYWKEKNFALAIEHLTSAVDQQSDYSAAWKVLGRAYLDNSEFEAAIGAFESGLAAAQKNGDKQTEKEMTVFQRRASKALTAENSDSSGTDPSNGDSSSSDSSNGDSSMDDKPGNKSGEASS